MWQTAVKRQIDNHPEHSVRRSYYAELNQLPVAEAALTAPLSEMERSMQRYKVRNRPELPATRQDLILQLEHTITTSGLPFVLIDDGVPDRILVFGSEANLHRYVISLSYGYGHNFNLD